jgi:hypothetical protein
MINPASLPPNILQALQWLATQPQFSRMFQAQSAGAPSLQSPPTQPNLPNQAGGFQQRTPSPVDGILGRLFGTGSIADISPSALQPSGASDTRPSFRYDSSQSSAPPDPTLAAFFGTGDISGLSPGDLTAAFGRQAAANQSNNSY